MPRTENEADIIPSLLDRLTGEPEPTPARHLSHAEQLQKLKQAVRRDLEWMFNTRRTSGWLPAEFKELNRSLAVYGLPDFTDSSIHSSTDGLRLALETSVLTFEPRLRNPVITFDKKLEAVRGVRFHIEAQLYVEPYNVPVTFITTLFLGSGTYSVQEKQ